MNATEILVIILSSFLAIFLIAGIVLSVLLIKVTLQIRRVTTKAEAAANSIETMTKNVSSAASKTAVTSLLLKGLKLATKRRKK